LLLAETGFAPAQLRSILNYGGLPMDYRCIMSALEEAVAAGVAA
jgi:hypothetical protein